ncbi:reverse transcriptase domain-containing protein [Tanacetum coccineum]
MLRCNLDIFAWKPADMTGVPRHIAEHRLNVRKGCPPIRQKRRGQAADRNKAIQEKVGKLVDAEIMKEVHYHNWLSNPVMVKKHDGSWRMCVYFKDLNKACPKDGYPLPEIDWKVESLCGFPFKCFLDAYKGYHQIKMAKEDEEKTAFITSQGIYFYSKMSFGLRNAGTTYQRLMDKAFHKQVGRNLEVYLNPKKCTFGVEEGMFLGYKVNTKGIKVPSKVSREVATIFQNLEKCTKKSDFCWTDEAESAFKHMKQHIAELPMLTTPEEKEELMVYLAAARETISAFLMTEREAKQMPIYFVSRALRGLEVNYTSMEKLVLALVHILPDFIVERPEEDSADTPMKIEEKLSEPWILFTDGSSCADGSRVGLILTSLEGMEFTYALRFGFEATNNEAKYEALIAGLRIAEQMGIKSLQANVDSRLVANQVNGTYIAKKADMIRYLEKVKTLANGFRMFTIKQLKEKSINEVEVLVIVEEEGETWMTPIHDYITGGILPAEADRARAVKRKSQRYSVVNGICGDLYDPLDRY